MTSVLIADDHPLFRDALAAAVKIAAPHATILHASSAHVVFDMLPELPAPALLLLDLRMPDSAGFDTLLGARAIRADIPVIIVSAEESAEVIARCRVFGASAYLPKSATLDSMASRIRSVLSQDLTDALWPDVPAAANDMADRIASLSPTQMKVLLGVLDGRLNKQIAHDLGVSEVTIKAHMTAVFRKLNVINRTQAVLAAHAIGLGPAAPIEMPD